MPPKTKSPFPVGTQTCKLLDKLLNVCVLRAPRGHAEAEGRSTSPDRGAEPGFARTLDRDAKRRRLTVGTSSRDHLIQDDAIKDFETCLMNPVASRLA